MSSYTEGQSHQLMERFEKEGFTPEHITKLGQFSNLGGIKNVLEGTAKIGPVAEDVLRVITINETTIAVNLSATPKLPFDGVTVEQHVGNGWAIVEKRTDGLYINDRKVVLHLSKRQQNGKRLTGYELREELTGKSVLNANIFDALHNNSHLIPEEWRRDEKGNARFIYFWGTIYRNALGHLCVRYLYFDGDAWYRYYIWLDVGWYDDSPAVLLASS